MSKELDGCHPSFYRREGTDRVSEGYKDCTQIASVVQVIPSPSDEGHVLLLVAREQNSLSLSSSHKISGPSLPCHSGVYLTSLELLPRVAPKLSESFDIRFLKALYDGQFTSMPFSIGLLRGCVQRVQRSKDLVLFPIYCRLGWLEFTNECQILNVREDYVD